MKEVEKIINKNIYCYYKYNEGFFGVGASSTRTTEVNDKRIVKQIHDYYTTLFKSCVPEKKEDLQNGDIGDSLEPVDWDEKTMNECINLGNNYAIDQLNKNMERSGL